MAAHFGMVRRAGSISAVLVALFGVLGAASAAERSPIQIIYVPPKEQAHEPIYRALRDRQVLERVRNSLTDFTIPAKLTIKTEGCDGDINASYESSKKTVSICYEYLAYIQELAQDIPPIAAAEGLTPANYVVGPFLEVVLHELAHAVFDLNKVPILGREEDAADQVAAYALLRMDKQEVRRTIASIAAMYASEAKDAPPKLKDLSDEHGLPAQRFFNLLCISYGKEPAMFADIVAQGFLPKERAEQCKGEYQQVASAIARLIATTPKNTRRQTLSKKT